MRKRSSFGVVMSTAAGRIAMQSLLINSSPESQRSRRVSQGTHGDLVHSSGVAVGPVGPDESREIASEVPWDGFLVIAHSNSDPSVAQLGEVTMETSETAQR
ncbi:uncharacterized protein TRUGW13939_11029 [Talaromyces rugulosus]|uniref:Uncharacterized protein n=1 Tax=Talaromyces rugulosus TaxID=121627 RepID=A0A7H8RCY8_TALRU|nr:uncharacterized protein TRUGW13939_11029 [Talaromyces rugulosus]QKX63858.1 hypothetical protein TRUGW13939_11029 [Talaromyces rugulosus]